MSAKFKVNDYVLPVDGNEVNASQRLLVTDVKEFKTKPAVYSLFNEDTGDTIALSEQKLTRWISPEEKSLREECKKLAEEWYEGWYKNQKKYVEEEDAIKKTQEICNRTVGSYRGHFGNGLYASQVEVGHERFCVKLYFDCNIFSEKDERKIVDEIGGCGFEVPAFGSTFRSTISMSGYSGLDAADAMVYAEYLRKAAVAVYEYKAEFENRFGFRKSFLINTVANTLFETKMKKMI